jgi:hypothetical protein
VLHQNGLFGSFFLGGFECSTHSRQDGTRLDLISSTCHDRFAELDYRRLQSEGMRACRDGLRWHLIGRERGKLNFASARPQVEAARKTGMQVIWDLLHYGWPDYLDALSTKFLDEFARYCRAAARFVSSEMPGPHWFSVVNEPSFLCWAGGHMGIFPPFRKGCGDEFKKQLIRATIAGIEAVRDVVPDARFLQVDPLINIVTSDGAPPHLTAEAEGYRLAQFDCLNILTGALSPEVGGHPKYLDVIGCNYYVHNQWEYQGAFIERSDPRYKPLYRLLGEVWDRYRRPLMIAETGIEDERRPEWLAYVCDEVEVAIRLGTPVHGICLYPVMNHPGWVDDRHCHNGLWDYCNEVGAREIYTPLADELRLQQARFHRVLSSPERDRETAGAFA